MVTMTVLGVDAQLVEFRSNIKTKTVVFVVALVGLDGNPLGQISIAVGPEGQVETETQQAIPGWDEMMRDSKSAQDLLAAVSKFGIELVDKYSKQISVES